MPSKDPDKPSALRNMQILNEQTQFACYTNVTQAKKSIEPVIIYTGFTQESAREILPKMVDT